MIAITFIFVAIYLVWYIVSLCVTAYRFRGLPNEDKIMVSYNFFMMIITLITFSAGVY